MVELSPYHDGYDWKNIATALQNKINKASDNLIDEKTKFRFAQLDKFIKPENTEHSSMV